jgi:RNA polymerase sigma-70 factor (ECF subfamily)
MITVLRLKGWCYMEGFAEQEEDNWEGLSDEFPLLLPFIHKKNTDSRMLFFKRSPKKLPADDADLLRQYRDSGDLQVLGELYERYMHLVFGVCLKYLRDEEESKDATMQIFEKLVTDLRIHEVKNFGSWLHTLSRNHCLMLLRNHRTHSGQDTIHLSSDEDMEFDIAVHPDEEDTEYRLAQMEEGMNELPEEQKVCLELFYIEQKSYKEICDLTGFDFKQVKSYLQNGKRNLKIYLDKTG